MSSGGVMRGSIDAPSTEDAREQLRKKDLSVEELHEVPAVPAPAFGTSMPWTTTEEDAKTKKSVPVAAMQEPVYVPLTDTLRLFAGWLLAWYALIYVLGQFQTEGRLPLQIPFLEALFVSPLVLRFTFATFLFLLLTSVQRATGKGMAKGLILGIIGIIAFALFHLNA